VLPWLDRHPVRSATFRPIFKIFFWIFLLNGLMLGWCGSQLAEGLPLVLSRIGTFWYFFHFIVLLPLLSWIETPKPLPASISQPVLSPALKPAE
jgi:ubiquinol-cytochrome c reductase cytochrome b subunit